ncbi:rhodanese-like domain-containing protein [Kocuria marina]|uniref:rhodanese-like domain-containing protein n=1 Tax=Kocuria marina TaxID=223184 RepID=UPI000A71BBE8
MVICRSGARSTRAAELLASAGMTSATVLTGGIDAWRDAGRTVRTGAGIWNARSD